MKQSILLTLLSLFSVLHSYGQWQATGLSTGSIENVWDLVSHKGILYVSGNTNGLQKSTDEGQSWTKVEHNAFTTNPTSLRIDLLADAGDALYAVTFNPYYASSMVYKSLDGGETFETDTVGLPKNTGNNELVAINSIHYHQGHLVIVFNNIGNWHKQEDSGTWEQNKETNTDYSQLFAFHNGKFYTWGGLSYLYISDDYGQSWTQAAGDRLPSWFNPTVIHTDESTGRIYIAGSSMVTNKYAFLYSDDEGASWDSLAVSQYLQLNNFQIRQKIQRIYSQGDLIILGLDKAQESATANVLISRDGGQSFAPDTDGLPTSTVAGIAAKRFVALSGKLYMALNFTDVYRKDLSVTTAHTERTAEYRLEAYPNPCTDMLYIGLPESRQSATIRLYSARGEQLSEPSAGMLDVSGLAPGLYLLHLYEGTQLIETRKIIKK